MICLVALIVFSILGVFSVRYRELSRKAVDCVFRRITLRPCQSGMDRQLKNQLIGTISRKNIALARFFAKYFEIISWIFTLLLIASLFLSAQGIYNYILYGNCNGLGSDEFCVFDALNPKEEYSCEDPSLKTETKLVAPGTDNEQYLGPEYAKVTIIEFGCYTCQFTKEAQPTVKEILEKYPEVKFVFRDFPLPIHNNSRELSKAAYCAGKQGKYWEFHEGIFDGQDYISLAKSLDLDTNLLNYCMASEEAEIEVNLDFEDGRKAGIYGTPTFFINNVTIVGPKPFRYFKTIIDAQLKS